MILHLSKFIGEKSLLETEDESSLEVELRNIKRALVISCMEKMCQAYVKEDSCTCETSQANQLCPCITETCNSIPGRMSQIQKMATRLFFASSNIGSDKRTNMRMREICLYWMNTKDPVIMKNAHLLHKKSISWAADADAALCKLASILEIDAVQLPSDDEAELNNDFADPFSMNEIVAHFDDISASSQRSSQSQSQSSHVQFSSIEAEIENFLKQPSAHFTKCKNN